ncbi:topoisomerase C-terminal repeat-containing protein [Gracilibacillus sp. YIM 98692]|uniref:topoisomerase C-terminal repeat-containing protein n=1 Tax=Gracilibacillus sp. YIM 98692 TaxID=2663532 RepID=UPI001F08B53B|nr:topoisomerase C-terminal repeat-containing protein [Gracilibacillus sp. YIM 98692]
MEQTLSEIGKGKQTYHSFVQRVAEITQQRIPAIQERSHAWDFQSYHHYFQKEESIGACLACGEEVIELKDFYGCSGYRQSHQCRFKVNKKIAGKSISLRYVKDLLTKGQTEFITGFQSSTKEGTFNACLVWDETKGKIGFRFTR